MAYYITQKLIHNDLILEKKSEYYIYILTAFIEKTIVVGSIILISLFFGLLVPSVIFLVFFLSLRKRTGGYHANTFLGCYLGTIAIYLGILAVNTFLTDFLYWVLAVMIIAVCIVLAIGIINHPNLEMDDNELTMAKKAARRMVILQGCFVLLMLFTGLDTIYINYMATAIILCATLLLLAKLLKQEVSIDNKC